MLRTVWRLVARPRSTRPARLGDHSPRRRLRLEFLEPRDVPSGLHTQYVLLPRGGGAGPFGGPGPTGTTPAQIRHAYGFDQISFNGGAVPGDGRGTTVAIVDAYDDPNVAGDLRQFDAAFALPDPTFTKVNQTGGTTMPAANGGWASEIALDVEWAHTIAPKANILLVESNDNSFSNLLTAVKYAAAQPGVAAVSMSWGGGEFTGETGYDSTFQTPAGHAGVTFVASSGDSGAPDSYPSASPNVLSVGGTTLKLTSSNTISSESGWSGSGGGISSVEAQPAYQNGVVTQTSTRRANPDVAYDADPNTGFPVYDSYNNGSAAPWSQFGGTSDAAPQWAALIAIADQGRALAGLGALDGPTQTLPALYSLPSADFHDITSGTSAGSPNYSAGPGYDLVTGRGSPLADKVVADLVGPSQWKFVGGAWTQSGGVLSQTSTAAADVRKAEFVGQSFGVNVEVDARVRVDSWTNGDYARAGVGLYTNPVTGDGYNLVFHNGTGGAGTVQFLDDHVAWGNAYSFAWTVGTWYDFKLRMDGGVLYGKVWQDGTAEPANWQFSQSGWTDRSSSGAAALNGGAGGAGNSTATFDTISVFTPPAAPAGLTATAASSTAINLAWNSYTGATAYKVQRSQDGQNWTPLASVSGNSYADTGLNAGTTYSYRVSAVTATADSLFSAVASATTNTSGGGVLFSDDFSGPSLNPVWHTVGGTWALGGGALSQTATTDGDPRKAVVTGVPAPANVEVDARVRVDSWTAGDYARAGVGLYTDAATGEGYNLVFHNGTGGAGTVQFLDDHVAWGNAYSFNWTAGTWYDFKLKMENGVLYGKVWQDGTAEPANWQFSQSGWTDRSSSGGAALNGGDTQAGSGSSAASFDDVVVKAI
ncbi:MAG: fibronectin type III domain-containing protein [Gemmataceae bacterium]